MKSVAWFWCFVLLFPVAGGCGKKAQDKETTYDIKGKVVAIDAAKKKVTLDHEDIPGHMKAMEMSFGVGNIEVLEGLKVGDQVVGKLTKENVILELRKR